MVSAPFVHVQPLSYLYFLGFPLSPVGGALGKEEQASFVRHVLCVMALHYKPPDQCLRLLEMRSQSVNC